MTEELRLRANGLQFRALAAGPEDGELVLLLHGFPEGAESWGPQLEALATAGFRAVAPDLRGYGGTDAPEGEAAYRVELLVDDVCGLVAALGRDRVHLAGHDWGSVVGWATASVHPELLKSWTALSVPHPYEWQRAARADPDQQARSAYIQLFLIEGKAEQVLSADGYKRLIAIYQGVIPEAVVEVYLLSISRPGRLTAALNYYRANLRSGASFEGYRQPVSVRSMLIWGSVDLALGRAAVDATATHLSAPFRLEVLEGAGHWLQFERAAEVSRLLVEHLSSDWPG